MLDNHGDEMRVGGELESHEIGKIRYSNEYYSRQRSTAHVCPNPARPEHISPPYRRQPNPQFLTENEQAEQAKGKLNNDDRPPRM
jgi:hypothetical protein